MSAIASTFVNRPATSGAVRLTPATFTLVTSLALSMSAGACSSDIFDVNVALMAEVFHADFGTSTGSVPAITCTAQTVTMCGPSQVIALTDDAGEIAIMSGCDAAVSRCFVQANALVRYTVNVLKDEGFTSKVARKSVSAVRMLDIAYRLPSNTTTFDIPKLEVWAGPEGSRTATDGGVELVDTLEAIPAGTVIAGDPRHLTIADGSPARELIERSIKAKIPFVFMITVAPRLQAGAPLPAGAFDIEMQPLLGLGLR